MPFLQLFLHAHRTQGHARRIAIQVNHEGSNLKARMPMNGRLNKQRQGNEKRPGRASATEKRPGAPKVNIFLNVETRAQLNLNLFRTDPVRVHLND